MASALPCTVSCHVRRNVQWLENPLHVVVGASQVFRSGAHINIELAANLVVVDFGGSQDRFDIRYHPKARWLAYAIGMQRNGFEILDCMNLRFGVLNSEEVIVSVFAIDP